MNQQQKIDYLRSFRKFQSSREAAFIGKFNKALKKQVQQYIDSGNVQGISFEPIFKVLSELYKSCAVTWGDKVRLSIRRQQAKGRMPIGFSERIFNILKDHYAIDLLNDAIGITETTKELIQKILTESAAEGFGIDEIVKRITDDSFTEKRARTIARTETVAASNIGGDIVARESGLAMNKEWLAILDHRTRHDHYNVHGTLIDINSTFNVGGSFMRFPGDRGKDGIRVPGKETINCRCVCVYIPKVDSRGLAIAA